MSAESDCGWSGGSLRRQIGLNVYLFALADRERSDARHDKLYTATTGIWGLTSENGDGAHTWGITTSGANKPIQMRLF